MSVECAEGDRVVVFGDIFVVERAIGNLRDPFELGAKQRIGLVLRRAGFRERGGKLARPGEPRPRAVDAVDMHAQYLPNCPPYVTAGVDVIAENMTPFGRSRRPARVNIASRTRAGTQE